MVVYSTHLGGARRRFTIAHELAHAVFEKSGPNCPRSGKELERLCDMLAAEFLMPREVFLRQSGSSATLSWERIGDLADLFQTSLSASSLEVRRLTRCDCVRSRGYQYHLGLWRD